MRENLIFHILFGLNTIVCIAGSNHPLIIISFDGLQAGRFEQFIKLNPNCAFNSIINDGVKAKYLIPSFPTLTIPNHITLATGI
jgi:predicted AlkP superfamily pyrophosphatase or phosphodiesterase